MPTLSIGKFQVLATLGTGAHSTILHIRRQEDGKPYALKVVPIGGPQDRKFMDQAEHEFEIAQQLNHPSLIKIYTLEKERDWLFRVRKLQLLIEYVNGRTLDTFKVIPMAKLVQVFQQVAQGLAHMHARGIFHADLKPNNILLSRTGAVKVIDYGLAWVKGQEKKRIQGTPEYMAPETAGQSVVNERTDIYNFGATMYRLVTWRYPPRPTVQEGGLAIGAKLWDKLIKPVQECNAEAPPELAQVIQRCLAFEPSKRPQKVSDVQVVLDQLVKKLVRTPEDRLEAFQW